MNRFLLIICTAFFIFSCAKEQEQIDVADALKAFKAIEGEWLLQGEGNGLEHWSSLNDGYVGRGMVVSELGDTTITEVYFLEPQNDSLRLQVQPITSSGISIPIDYFMTKMNKNQFVFENSEHNFPKKITYLINDKRMTVYLDGDIEGYGQQAELVYLRAD